MTPAPRPDAAAVPAAEALLARWIGLDPDTIGSASIARAAAATLLCAPFDEMIRPRVRS